MTTPNDIPQHRYPSSVTVRGELDELIVKAAQAAKHTTDGSNVEIMKALAELVTAAAAYSNATVTAVKYFSGRKADYETRNVPGVA